jgi:hypothetical protein
MLWQLKDTQVSEKMEHSPAAAHRIDERSSHDDEAARGLGDKVRDAGSQMAGHATELLKEAQTRGASVVGEVKDQAVSATHTAKDGIADRLDDVAKAIHSSGAKLEGHQDWIAHIVERGSRELGALASTLRTNDLHGLLGKLDDLARRQPAVFVGAAMAAGFAAVRLGRVAVAGATQSDLPHMPERIDEPK